MPRIVMLDKAYYQREFEKSVDKKMDEYRQQLEMVCRMIRWMAEAIEAEKNIERRLELEFHLEQQMGKMENELVKQRNEIFEYAKNGWKDLEDED